MDILRTDTIAKKFLSLTIILTVILLGGLGTALIINNNTSIRSLMASKGEAMANYMAKTSTSFYLEFDFSSLEGFVQEAIKDHEVKFAIFYDEKMKPVTEKIKEPEDISSLLIYEKEIRHDDKIIGYLKLGLTQEALNKNMSKGIRTVVISIIISLILLVIVISLNVHFVVTKPMEIIINAVNKMMKGDLSAGINYKSRDEMGRLADDMDKMAQSFNNMINGILTSINTLASAAAELAATSEQMSVSANSQASQINAVSTSTEEMVKIRFDLFGSLFPSHKGG